MPLMNPEKPLFFLHGLVLPEPCKLFVSPESLLVGVNPPPSELVGVRLSKVLSPAEKLADCRSDGVNIR